MDEVDLVIEARLLESIGTRNMRMFMETANEAPYSVWQLLTEQREAGLDSEVIDNYMVLMVERLEKARSTVDGKELFEKGTSEMEQVYWAALKSNLTDVLELRGLLGYDIEDVFPEIQEIFEESFEGSCDFEALGKLAEEYPLSYLKMIMDTQKEMEDMRGGDLGAEDRARLELWDRVYSQLPLVEELEELEGSE